MNMPLHHFPNLYLHYTPLRSTLQLIRGKNMDKFTIFSTIIDSPQLNLTI